jgi:polygalacturonase
MHTSRRLFLACTTSALACATLRSTAALAATPQPSSTKTNLPPTSKVTLNAKECGAIGDGKALDTLALQQAIDRCSMLGGGEVVVPAGSYATGALVLRSHVTLRLEKDASLLGIADRTAYPITQVRWEGKWIKGYSALISAVDSEEIAILGPGKIVGSPTIQGRIERPSNLRLPALLEFVGCRNVRVADCATTNGGMWSIHPVYCENIRFNNVIIVSGADGIDVDSCRKVVIEGCDFTTADDCISLKSGRGEEGYKLHRPTEEVRIANCTFVDSHFACIGIGSELSAGVRSVQIENCTCRGARSHAIYIKTRAGRGAFIEDIFVDGFEVSGAQQGFLRLNSTGSGKQDEHPVPGDEGLPTLRNFRFTNIRVHDVPMLVHGTEIDPRKPLVGFSLTKVTGTAQRGITLANVHDAVLDKINVTIAEGPLLATHNVSGKGLAGAVALSPDQLPKTPDAIPVPAVPYQLH